MRFWLPILSGILIGTSYIPFPPWALLFGLVPLLIYWLNARSAREAFIGGWITQFVLNLIGFHWIAYTAIEFGHFSKWAGGLTLLAFASLAHLFFPLAGYLHFKINQHMKSRFEKNSSQASPRVLQIWLGAFLFALLQRIFPMLFPWHFGYAWLWANWSGAQLTDVIGFEGLNVATIAINAAVAQAVWYALQQRRRRAALTLAAAAICFAAMQWLGHDRETAWSSTNASVRFLAVQGNIGNFDKLMAERGREFREPIVDQYLRLTEAGLNRFPSAEWVIWPETAFPDSLDAPFRGQPQQNRVLQLAREKNRGLLTGAYSYDLRTRQLYNGFFAIDPGTAGLSTPYRKSILLMFGETFPLASIIPYEKFLPPDMGASFATGPGPSMIPLFNGPRAAPQPLRVGPQICYEGLYPWFSNGLAAHNSNVIVNVTNDSWFGRDFEPYQHLYMTLARAIEIRRPLIRVTNTGITTAILANGHILERSPIGVEWFGEYTISYQTDPQHTIYERFAHLWPALLLFLVIFTIVLDWFMQRGRRLRGHKE